jgi:aryl-alcohol dehydrogenase-like predicted oxidoreductase
VAKAPHLRKVRGWNKFLSLPNHYNLLAPEEERQMIPLAIDSGVSTIIWSPLARARLARAWDDARSTTRSETDGAYSDTSPTWVRRQPVVGALLVGAASIALIDKTVA